MTNFLNLVTTVSLVFASLTVSGCNSTGGTNAETRDEINRLNKPRERPESDNRRLSPGR